MDEEVTDMTSVTPEVIRLKSVMRRNSTGNIISTGSLSVSNSDGKILSRYLRPSMGSCHDFCKYGKDACEKGKHPFVRRSLSTISTEKQNQLESLNLGGRRKKTDSEPSSHSYKVVVKKQLRTPSLLSSVNKSIPASNFKVLKEKASTPDKKSVRSVKSKVLKQKVSSSVNRTDLSVKCAISLKRKPTVVSVLNPSWSLIDRRNQEVNITKTVCISETGKKVLKQPSAFLSTKISSNIALRMTKRKQSNAKCASCMNILQTCVKSEYDHDDIKEKTLCVDELILQKSEHCRSSESSKPKDQRRQNINATVDSKPQKLRFRRGKVVDLQPENYGPKRLRFRKGVKVHENSDGNDDVCKESVTKKIELVAPLLSNPGLGTEAVALKHQNFQGKKDSHGLFNHVIEETVTKLVGTRKSKVKVLVGAFEAVISLQEIKPVQPELAIQ